MAFDGITIASIVKELNSDLTGGRIYKIAQPETDELLITIKNNSSQYRLLLSADASLPLIYLTDKNKQSPMTAPGFCMLLRKHLQNARIINITQPGLERIIQIHLEHLNEMGDLCRKTLVIEIMGKHSNIIFCDDNDMIIDSIKHVSGFVSSVREVLPGKPYFVADTTHKKNPMEAEEADFIETILGAPMPVFKAVYTSYTGLSPLIAQELCARAGVDGERPAASDREALRRLFEAWSGMRDAIRAGAFSPCIAYTADKPVEFAAFPLTMYDGTFGGVLRGKELNYQNPPEVFRFAQNCADGVRAQCEKVRFAACADERYGKTGYLPDLRRIAQHLRLRSGGGGKIP